MALLALLAAVHEQGWTRFLGTLRDIGAIAEFTGLPPRRLADVLDALHQYGVVERDGTTVCLSPPFAALAADDAWLALGDTLDNAELTRRLVCEAARGPAAALSGRDALIAARAAADGPRRSPPPCSSRCWRSCRSGRSR